MNLKTIAILRGKIILPAIAAVALIGGVALYRFLSEPDAPMNRKAAVQPAYRMQIEGLRFYGTNQGRRVVYIEADRFTLGKGKIGFFSTGLTRRATIENATIDVYAGTPSYPGAEPDERFTKTPSEGASQPKGGKGGTAPDSFQAQDAVRNQGMSPLYPGNRSAQPPTAGEFDFGGLFDEETFSSLFPVRNVAEIEVSPVTVRLRNDHAILMRITAAKASVRLKEKAILFTGQVRVSSGSAEMTTEQLVFIPETSRLRTDGPFVLKQGGRTLEGSGLTTDLSLRPQ
jgi:hypothetical protein